MNAEFRFFFRALNVLLVGFALTLFSDASLAANYVQQENVVYHEAHGVGLVMDIFTPKEEANGLAIVQVVSGAWYSNRGKVNDLKRAMTFDIFCGRGYTVFAIRPGSITRFSAPEMVDHIEHGIRWAKSHAQEFKIDPSRIGMMGASAGGHLASLVAVGNGRIPSAETASIQAVGVFFPPTDFLDYGGQELDPRSQDSSGKRLSRLAFSDGIVPADEESMWQAVTNICPARLVNPKCPPYLLIHGDADPAVPLQQSEKMLAALQEKGIAAELIVKKGGGHPWLTIPVEIAKMADWFDSKLQQDNQKQEKAESTEK